jgi:hypothetical protein
LSGFRFGDFDRHGAEHRVPDRLGLPPANLIRRDVPHRQIAKRRRDQISIEAHSQTAPGSARVKLRHTKSAETYSIRDQLALLRLTPAGNGLRL